MYVLQVPGAGFGLAALGLVMYFSLFASEHVGLLFENPDTKTDPGKKVVPEKPPSKKVVPEEPTIPLSATLALSVSVLVGMLLGVFITALVVSVLLIPPSHLKQWILHPDPLHERVERALNPGEQWNSLREREREAAITLKATQLELAVAAKRVSETEASLSKAQDELATQVANIVRAIKIKKSTGSRHANGAIYIGVSVAAVGSYKDCSMHVSSDKVDNITKNLNVGEGVTVLTMRGKYRVILTAIDGNSCTFDLVKD
jgi:hypothetical protein